jgi:selenocysteine-specific elongation factor
VHFHHGSQEVLARIHLLDRDKLKNEERALAQVRFKQPLVGVFGDRIVLRSFSPLRTIAGGRLINPLGRKIKRFSSDLELLEELCSDDVQSIILTQLHMAANQGLSLAELQVLTNLQDKNLEKILQDLGGRQKVFLFDREERRYVLGQKVEELSKGLIDYIKDYHQRKPLENGISRSAIASDWGKELPTKLLHFLLERSLKKGWIISEQEVLRLPEHKVSLASDQEKLREKILKAYQEAHIRPPNFKELLSSLQISPKEAAPVFKLLAEKNELVKVKDELYFSPGAIEEIKGMVLNYFRQKSELSPTEFKELTGLSRKYAIPIMEYLDRQKVTMRVGDVRKLRRG